MARHGDQLSGRPARRCRQQGIDRRKPGTDDDDSSRCARVSRQVPWVKLVRAALARFLSDASKRARRQCAERKDGAIDFQLSSVMQGNAVTVVACQHHIDGVRGMDFDGLPLLARRLKERFHLGLDEVAKQSTREKIRTADAGQRTTGVLQKIVGLVQKKAHLVCPDIQQVPIVIRAVCHAPAR